MNADTGKYQSTVIGFSIVILILLYAKNGKFNIPAFFALMLLTMLSFAFPLVAFVLIIPVAFIVYENSYKQVGSFYKALQNIRFTDVN